MDWKSMVFALGFLVVSFHYFELGVSEMKKAISHSGDGPSSSSDPEH